MENYELNHIFSDVSVSFLTRTDGSYKFAGYTWVYSLAEWVLSLVIAS